MSQPVTEEKKQRKPRTPRQKPTEAQNQPTGILEESENVRTEKFKKLERVLMEQVAGIVGMPMLLIHFMHNPKLDIDMQIVNLSLPQICHNAVGAAMTNKSIETFLVAFTQDAAVFGLVTSILSPIVLIGMNHANFVPSGVFGEILANLAAGSALDDNSADRQRENVLSR